MANNNNYNHHIILAIMCIVILGAPRAAESALLTCGTVDQDLFPCLNYFEGGGSGQVPLMCCNGIRSLNAAAQDTADRQTVCRCLKQAASALGNVNMKLAAAIPSLCGVNLPYKLDPATDCSKIR